jgi:hypothetical protein
MKTYWGSDLGTRWRWVVIFTPRPLYPQGKSPWYPLGGAQSRSGHGGEQNNFQPLPGLEPPINQPVYRKQFETNSHSYTDDIAMLTHLEKMLFLVCCNRNVRSLSRQTLASELKLFLNYC